jgi:GNAT superfamily N-acetyltransferase
VTDFRISIDDAPQPAVRESIVTRLVEYNETHVGTDTPKPLAIVLRTNESDDIIGGIWGNSFYDWLHVELLIVPGPLRNRGVGTTLMKTAEDVAKQRGCVGIRLDTFTFQAPAFYEKLGYRIFGRLPDHPRGHTRYFYCKRLDTAG